MVEFCSWLCKHGYNVQMDIMLTSRNQEDLKELGPWRWAERQLIRAKAVFVVISPCYLNFYGLDERKTDALTLTQEEKNTFSEITKYKMNCRPKFTSALTSFPFYAVWKRHNCHIGSNKWLFTVGQRINWMTSYCVVLMKSFQEWMKLFSIVEIVKLHKISNTKNLIYALYVIHFLNKLI